MASLQTQLEAMERAFEVQERVTSQRHASQKTDAAVHSDEYFELLQRWRRETLRSLVGKISADRQLARAIEEKKRLRAQASEQVQGLEAKLLCANERAAAISGQLALLKTQLAQEVESNACSQEAMTSLKERLSSQGQVLNQVRHIVEETWRGVAANDDCLRMSQAAARLFAMESRLRACSERLELARTAVALKEVSIRNSLAAFEAEKSLWLQRNQSRGDGEFDKSDDSSLFVSDVVLRPETEAILRSIFRMLDPEGSGSIPISSVLTCIDPETSSLHATLSTALGDRVMDLIGTGLRSLAAKGYSDVTWGELLLLFFPSQDESSPRIALDRRELRALQQEGLWGDDEWGVVALCLPPNKPGDNSALRELRTEEELRLSHERAYLMKRCQDMSRTLERRAEGIKAYFDRELKIKTLNEHSMQAQVCTSTYRCFGLISCR